MRRTARRQFREADDVAEVDGDAVEELGLNNAVTLELVGDARRQHLIEQALRLTLLVLQLCRLARHRVSVRANTSRHALHGPRDEEGDGDDDGH